MTARDFNGTTDRLDWAAPYDPTAQAQTFAAWADFDSQSGARYIFHAHNSTDTNRGLTYFRNGDASIHIQMAGSTDLQRVHASFSTGEHHIAWSWDGTTTATGVKHFWDGVEPSYGATINGVSLVAPTGSWSLGGRIYNDLVNCDGRLWHVGWWNRVLSADEIAALAAGYHPSFFPSGLVWCPDLSSLYDPYSGLTGTADGTTTQDSLGPQILPCGPMVWTAAPEAGATWHSRLSRNSRLLQGKL